MTKRSPKKKLVNADHSVVTNTVDLAVFFPDLEDGRGVGAAVMTTFAQASK